MRRFGSSILVFVFLVVALIPNLTYPPPAFAQAPPFSPPLPMPEDPLGQQPEQQLPEISVDVDVRDGHLTARVVDIWGPGRTPLVMRSYTNAQPLDPPPGEPSFAPLPPNSGPFRWQFNDILNIVGAEPLGPDGNRSAFRYVRDRLENNNLDLYQVYVRDVGSYARMELKYTCPPPPPPPPPPCGRECLGPSRAPSATTTKVNPAPRARPGLRLTANIQPAPSNCSWDGWHRIYLPKGRVRKFSSSLVADESDANGNVTTFVHTTFPDGVGVYVLRVTDPVGRSTNYSYERAYQVCNKRSPGQENIGECAETKWAYRLRAVTDPYNRTSTYTYDGNTLKVLSVTNAAGHITRHTYTAGGLLATITNPRGYTTTFDWISGPDGTPRISKVTAADGNATNYAYTHATTSPYRVVRTVVRNAHGHSTTYDMNSGDIVSVTNPLGNVTQYAYDARHNITQVTDPRGNRTTYAYNPHNALTQVVHASGTLNLTTNLEWNSPDEPQSIPVVETLRSVTNPREIRAEYTYDNKHNLTTVKRAAGAADESLTQYAYTPWGGVASVTDPRGNTTTYAYATTRQLLRITPPAGGTTSFTYNNADDRVTVTNGSGRVWITAFNASRLVTSETDPLNNVVRHEYDANGNHTRTYDAKNQATTFAYDNRNRLTTITDALNGVTRYQYDAVGNLTHIINARNITIRRYTYDSANRVTHVTNATGYSTVHTYDAAGNLGSFSDRRGTTQTYTYDQANRLTQINAGGSTISHAYDVNGNRTSLTDGGGTTSFSYDNLDRLTRVTTPDNRSVQYAYDRTNNRTRLTYPDGSTTLNYAYDAANRLTQITQGSLTWTFGYNAAGNRDRLTQPNGTLTDYGYFDNNWLSSIVHRLPGGAVYQSFVYTYDVNGNRVSQTDGTGTSTFTYDALNRLTAASYPGTYGSWSWTYDSVGNRTSQASPSGTTPYTYDSNNRLTQAGAVTYSYDDHGNLISTSTGQSFSWDAFSRLRQASGSGGSVTYTYNGDGQKVRRTGPDGSTVYYHDGIRPIWEADGAGTPKAQLDRDIFGNLLSRREGSVRRYIASDGLGGSTGLTDEAGTFLAGFFYDAWGNIRASPGSWTGGLYLFTGAELDLATGLYNMGARFYDPTIGRWLSEDPIQDDSFNPLSLNFYSYAWNDPGVFIDSTGLYPAAVGVAVHSVVETYFRATFARYNARAEHRIQGFGLRLDMMMTTSKGLEVYELKPAWHLSDPKKLAEARTQQGRYIQALRAQGNNAVAGSTWKPDGTLLPFSNVFNIQLSSNPAAPGIIGYTLVETPDAAQYLSKLYGWDTDFAMIVLGILIITASNPALVIPAIQQAVGP